MKNILEKFILDQVNILVATKVGEGLGIQTCCLAMHFDLPETVASFIQSRGRVRMPLSEYAFLVNSANEREINLTTNFKKDEDCMNKESTKEGQSAIQFYLPMLQYIKLPVRLNLQLMLPKTCLSKRH